MLLGSPHAPRADCKNGEALVDAAMKGHEAVVRLLLPHFDRLGCQDGCALAAALQFGHDGVARLLSEWQRTINDKRPCTFSSWICERARLLHSILFS
jgi:hypothetical protein